MANVRSDQIIQGHHEYKDGSYVPKVYDHQEYPKTMFHRDYVHVKAADVDYPATASAVVVNDEKEEQALGEGWFASLAEAGHITAPSAEQAKAKALAAKPKGEEKKPKSEAKAEPKGEEKK